MLAALLCVACSRVSACGYDFVGGCSSNVSVKINGTKGTFVIAACTGQANFQGLVLGNIQSLRLAGAECITWESCQNNVSAGSLYYRVYKTGQTPGGWLNMNVPEDHSATEGPYTTRYRKADTDINLSAGLMVGSVYTLEVYFRVEVDTIGDDFIPETFHLQNNNGLNYKLQFTYGGSGAPPMYALVTHDVDVDCWGQHTGEAGVTAFGGLPGGTLFYQWSANSQNFFEIDSLPAGTYTVTVSDNPSGNTATASVQITQPTFPVMLNFTNITPATCTSQGSATVVASGGTPPLTWEWSNGDTLQTTWFNTGGHYAITVTDSKGCTQKGMVTIGGNGSIPIFELPEICEGEVYTRGNQSFTQEGLYTVNVPAPNGCDTIVEFYLNVVPAAGFLTPLPESAMLSCLQPLATFCPQIVPAASYTWQKNGTVLSTTPCLEVSSDGEYQLTIVTVEGAKTCQVSKTIPVSAHLTIAQTTATGTGSLLPPCGSGNIALQCNATHPEPVASWSWSFNNMVISSQPSCSITLVQPVTALPELTVVDIYGCSGTVTPSVTFESPAGFPSITGAQQLTQCNGSVSINVGVTGGNPPYTIDWSNGQTGNPVEQQPGFYFVNVTDISGCTASVAVFVEDFNISITSEDAGTSTSSDGSATATADGAFNPPVSYLWNTGDTSPAIEQLPPGEYCVTVTDNTGCTRTGCASISFTSDVQNQPFIKNTGLLLYPNPANPGDEVTIPANGVERALTLIGADGRIVLEQIIPAGQGQFKLPENLLPGVCFVVLKNEDFLQTGKIFLTTRR